MLGRVEGDAEIQDEASAKVGQRGPRWPEVQMDRPLAVLVGEGPRRPTLNYGEALGELG